MVSSHVASFYSMLLRHSPQCGQMTVSALTEEVMRSVFISLGRSPDKAAQDVFGNALIHEAHDVRTIHA